jgi:uncharacterized protein
MDLLRGFALIGIIMMNIEWFNRPVSELVSFDYTLTGLDWASSWLVKVFVEGKFYNYSQYYLAWALTWSN